jgi:RNA polymerase primary sigma factor
MKSITNRENPSLDKYLQEIGKISLITADEEIKLAQRIKTGDKRALDKLTIANLRFVVSVAKQYQNQGLSLLDLINEGNVGLVKAALRFDETRGFKFISYAVWWIRQSILQALSESANIVRVPPNQEAYKSKIRKSSNRLEQFLERLPSIEEISIDLEIPEYKIEFATNLHKGHISMDTPIQEDESTTMVENYEDKYSPTTDAKLMRESLEFQVQSVLLTLTSKERDIINLYYGMGVSKAMTLEEIGKKLDLTRERVRQIKEKAIRRLKHNTRSKILKTYLG